MKVRNLMSTCLFLTIATIIFLGCDPAFNYNFEGVVKCDGKALGDTEIIYHFLPKEKAENWRSHIKDSIVVTNEKGEFVIHQKTLTMHFDSLKISISKKGYEEYEMMSRHESWKRRFGLNKKDISNRLDPIHLVKIDSAFYCSSGITKARNESITYQFKHFEYLPLGTLNTKYWDAFERALNGKGISLEVHPMFQHPYPSNQYFHNECYKNEMKKILEEQFGVDWLSELKLQLKNEK